MRVNSGNCDICAKNYGHYYKYTKNSGADLLKQKTIRYYLNLSLEKLRRNGQYISKRTGIFKLGKIRINFQKLYK